jgi:hypothetical protein
MAHESLHHRDHCADGVAQARAAEIKADAWLAKLIHPEALFACIKQHTGEPSVRLVAVL